MALFKKRNKRKYFYSKGGRKGRWDIGRKEKRKGEIERKRGRDRGRKIGLEKREGRKCR